jgi:protein transport protein SEC23
MYRWTRKQGKTAHLVANMHLMEARANVNNSSLMLHSTLMSYSFNKEPDVILLLDTFFLIFICHGETIAAWHQAECQNQEGYENFKEVLGAPVQDAQELLVDRNSIPRCIVCDQGGSQARFLLSKLNPSTTHMTGGTYDSGPASGQAIFANDVVVYVALVTIGEQRFG